jgi:hypothetical protein
MHLQSNAELNQEATSGPLSLLFRCCTEQVTRSNAAGRSCRGVCVAAGPMMFAEAYIMMRQIPPGWHPERLPSGYIIS